MAKKQSGVRPYQSSYGYEWVCFADYIAEKMCIKKALQEKRPLPQLYKNDSEWKKFFAQQVYYCNKLVKEASKGAILAALKRSDLSWCFSLMSPKVRQTIFEELRKEKAKPSLNLFDKVPKELPEEKPPEAPSNISSRKPTSISKLDD